MIVITYGEATEHTFTVAYVCSLHLIIMNTAQHADILLMCPFQCCQLFLCGTSAFPFFFSFFPMMPLSGSSLLDVL